MNFPILSSLILLPTIGALFILFTKSSSGKYLIKELCHHFMIGKNITSMKLIRDSYGFSEPKVAT